MFNPVNLLSTLVGAGASRPAGGLPRPAYPPPPDFQGAGIPRRRTDRGGLVWAAPSDVDEPVLTPTGRAVREGGRLKTRALLREAPGEPVQVDGKQVPLRSETAPIRRSRLLCPLDK